MSLEPPSAPASTASGAVDRAVFEHPFLRGLKPAHLRIIADSAVRMRHEAGGVLFREGEPANRFYLIERGRVRLESPRRDETPVPIEVVGAGDVLGWSWLFPPYHWHFDAQAIEPTSSILVYAARLREHCEADHEFAYELMKRMTHAAIRRLQAAHRGLLDGRAA